MDKIEELLTRGIANIIPSKESLRKLLKSSKKLSIYLGIDPTATKIHLGHAVPLRKLQKFSELNHNVTFLIGDFTALIGDTSDKDTERPILTSSQIEENFKTYKKQAEKILDFSKITIRHNSEWLDKISSRDFIKLSQQFSFGDFASRELIKKRLNSSKHVGLHEGLYPAMQGYDSYFMDTDVQIGGTDQTFNMQAGRVLQKNWRNKESFVLATEFLMGTDGRKMSKTWNNAIWLDDNPNDMYRKVMAINDNLIIQYFTLATILPMTAIKNIEEELKNGGSPLNAKKELARQVVKELHGEKDAEDAENQFKKVVQEKNIIFEVYTPKDFYASVLDIVSDLTTGSRSESKRLIEQSGVSVGDKIINLEEANMNVTEGMKIKIGKRKAIEIRKLKAS